jgi:hypothetical protein
VSGKLENAERQAHKERERADAAERRLKTLEKKLKAKARRA